MEVKFKTREICAVNRDLFHWGDSQTSSNVLFDLEDGAEVVNIEVSKNVNKEDYLCHIVIMNKNYDIRIASNGRGQTKREAITTSFYRAKIAFINPTIEDFNESQLDIYRYRITPVMEAIAQELGVKRYQIFSAGSEPLR